MPYISSRERRGIEKGIVQVTQKLLAENIAIDFIAKVTGYLLLKLKN